MSNTPTLPALPNPAAPRAERIDALLACAVLAPSTRNTQPWRFAVAGNRIDLWIDPTRAQPVADADQREMFISAGCALENLLLAAPQLGFEAHAALMPAPAQPLLAASVTLTDRTASTVTPLDAELFAQIPHRHTHHGAYDGQPLAATELAALEAAARIDDVTLAWADEHTRPQIDALVEQADRALFAQAPYRRELGRWIGTGAFGTSAAASALGRVAVSYLQPVSSFAAADRKVLATSPAFGVLCAGDGGRASQVAVGRALERVYLAAARAGLAVQPVSQLLQHADTRAALTALLPASRVPLQPFRLGRPVDAARATPRRPLADVVSS